MPAMLEINDATFCGQYLAANAPEVLFWRIESCAKVAPLGHNPYTDRQLINNTIRLLLNTGLYVRLFEEWDHLAPATQTWVALCTLIQEVFQRCLNATAPTAGHHGYAPTLPFQQIAFGPLAADDNDDKESIVEGMADQVAALTYQSELTASTAAITNQCNMQQLAAIEANQQATHNTLHQIIAQLNAVTFNASNAGRGCVGGLGRGRGHGRGFGRGLFTYVHGGFPTPHGGGIPPAPPPHGGGFPPSGGGHGGYQRGPTQPPGYIPSSVFHGGQTQNPVQYCSPQAQDTVSVHVTGRGGRSIYI
jgi:hypothetical protein